MMMAVQHAMAMELANFLNLQVWIHYWDPIFRIEYIC